MPPKEDDGGGSGWLPPEGLKLDKNPWPDIKKRAGNKDWIQFEPGAAVKLGQAISDLKWRMFELRGNAQTLTWMPDWSVPEIASGPALAKEFAKQGTEMYRILDAHHKILEDMLDSIVAAGKNMETAETGNVDDLHRQLDTISSDYKGTTHAPMGTVPDPLDQRTGDDPWHDRKSKQVDDVGRVVVKDGKRRYDTEATRYDPGEYDSGFHVKDNRKQPNIAKGKGNVSNTIGESQGKEWETLHANRSYLERHDPATWVKQDAGEWKIIGDTLKEAGTTFNTIASEVLNSADVEGDKTWQGDGAGAIKAALKGYVAAMEPLAAVANQYEPLLNYVTEYLSDTKKWGPSAPTEDLDPDYYLTDRQQMFGETYVRGANFTAKNIPKLVYPTEAFNDIPPIFHSRDKNKDGKLTGKEKIPGDKNNDGKLTEAERKAYTKAQGPGPGPGGPGPGPGLAKAKTGPGPAPGMTPEQKKQQREAAERARKAQEKSDRFAEEQRKDAARRAKAQEEYEKKQRADNDRRQSEAEQRAKDSAADQAAYQREMQEKAKQQQADSAAKDAASQAQRAAQEGLQAAQQAAQEALAGTQQGATEALAAAQQAAQSALNGSGMPKMGDLAGKLGGPGPGPATAKGLGLTEAAKLFPRAGAATAATSGTGLGALGRAGAAPGQMAPGSPGPAGAAGQGAGQGQQGHKRPAYLESDTHLDELLGEAPKVVRPVVEQ
ncbi:hypothetical protein ACFVMC_01995 [Nocardia sp. NPDC127579]|uniref:hypothetical protein n=1 Tax=Nocardia sp. NPDC127579 TaxID=3345402 RepID=UPI0036390128